MTRTATSFAVVIAAALAVGLVAGCGAKPDHANTDQASQDANQGAAAKLESTLGESAVSAGQTGSASPVGSVREVFEKHDAADAETTKAMLSSLATGIKLFRIDHKRLPASLQESDAKWTADPWGNEFVYRPGGDGRSFTLYSLGPDGKNGTADDVRLGE